MANVVLTQEGYANEVTGERFGVRAAAHIVDVIVLLIANFAVQFTVAMIIGIVFAISGRVPDMAEAPGTALSCAAGLLMNIFYFTLFEGLYGATPGKGIFAMRVVMEDGAPCTLGAALVRALLRFVDSLFFAVVAYGSMKPPLYQRVGDKAADTIVVKAKDPIIQKRRTAGWFLVAAGGYVVLQMIVASLLFISTLGS